MFSFELSLEFSAAFFFFEAATDILQEFSRIPSENQEFLTKHDNRFLQSLLQVFMVDFFGFFLRDSSQIYSLDISGVFFRAMVCGEFHSFSNTSSRIEPKTSRGIQFHSSLAEVLQR